MPLSSNKKTNISICYENGKLQQQKKEKKKKKKRETVNIGNKYTNRIQTKQRPQYINLN